MLGNIFRESGVVHRLSDTAQNALINIITIMLGLSVGATANGEIFFKITNYTNNCTRSIGLCILYYGWSWLVEKFYII